MSQPSSHPFVVVRLRPQEVELAELWLWELGATGIEQRDQNTIVRESAQGEVVLRAAFDDERTARSACDAIVRHYRAELEQVPHQNWATEWRKGFGPQRIGRRLVLHPSWEPVEGGPGDVVLEIDPENAFGSGDHETTRLVLRLLDQRVTGGERVLDVGCGSGILSIAAIRLGAASALGVDIEDDAVDVATRNAALNAATSATEFSKASLDRLTGSYEIVLANIETRVLRQMTAALRARMAPGAILVLSGILLKEKEAQLAAYSAMHLEELVEEGEWCACVLTEGPP